MGTLPNGTQVYIACQTSGNPYATGGTPASDSIWDGLTSGTFVADYWLSTPAVGTFTAGIPQCGTTSLATRPSVAAWPGGTQDVYWKSSGNGLWHGVWDANSHQATPQAYQLLATNDMASAPTAATVSASGQVVAFWKNTSGYLEEMWWQANNWYHATYPQFGILGSAPSVAVWPGGTQDVYWKGSGNNGLWHAVWNAQTGFTGPYLVPNVSDVASAPTAATVSASDQVVVFWQNTSGYLGEAWSQGPDWNNWYHTTYPQFGILGSEPSVAVWPGGTQDVYWKGSGNYGLWHAVWNAPTGFTGPSLVSNVSDVASAPSAATVSVFGQVVIFWMSLSGILEETWWQGNWAPNTVTYPQWSTSVPQPPAPPPPAPQSGFPTPDYYVFDLQGSFGDTGGALSVEVTQDWDVYVTLHIGGGYGWGGDFQVGAGYIGSPGTADKALRKRFIDGKTYSGSATFQLPGLPNWVKQWIYSPIANTNGVETYPNGVGAYIGVGASGDCSLYAGPASQFGLQADVPTSGNSWPYGGTAPSILPGLVRAALSKLFWLDLQTNLTSGLYCGG
jgi:hypothetical protein